ncbi:MAG: hypothetical protein C0497_04650 [Gemmatimonas sp.]|nr:hypothetical protein [Gemmatimonas sp.]
MRESLMATLVAARLADAAHGPGALPAPLRAERAASARHWMGALTLAAPLRGALGRLLDATAGNDAQAVATALSNVTEVTAPFLDRKARSELDRLTRLIGA